MIQVSDRVYTSISNQKINLTNSWTRNSVMECIKGVMERGVEVYQFDTIKDCLKWMSE